MKPTRTALLTVLTAFAAASTASAQTYTFTQTELGRIVPARFVTTTQALVANVDIAVAAPMIVETVSTDAATASAAQSDELSTWNTLARVDADGDEKAEANEGGFLGSTMGRASIVGLAGLAGASYFALRSDAGSAGEPRLLDPSIVTSFEAASPIGTVTPLMTATPEPASFALMAVGLGGLALAARRRRSN